LGGDAGGLGMHMGNIYGTVQSVFSGLQHESSNDSAKSPSLTDGRPTVSTSVRSQVSSPALGTRKAAAGIVEVETDASAGAASAKTEVGSAWLFPLALAVSVWDFFRCFRKTPSCTVRPNRGAAYLSFASSKLSTW
jgi:hypothetical protein